MIVGGTNLNAFSGSDSRGLNWFSAQKLAPSTTSKWRYFNGVALACFIPEWRRGIAEQPHGTRNGSVVMLLAVFKVALFHPEEPSLIVGRLPWDGRSCDRTTPLQDDVVHARHTIGVHQPEKTCIETRHERIGGGALASPMTRRHRRQQRAGRAAQCSFSA